jgi:hypothetical protein
MADSPYARAELEAIHQAFTDALAIAKERDERIPSSAVALRSRADNLRAVRDKILTTMPEVDRRNYPPVHDNGTRKKPR